MEANELRRRHRRRYLTDDRDAPERRGLIVQGVKDKKKLLASDLYQSVKICIHGSFHVLNRFRSVAVLKNQQEAL